MDGNSRGLIQIKDSTRCNSVLKFISYLYEAQHVSGDTAHHQEPKTVLAASVLACVEGCWLCSCWTLSALSQWLLGRQPSCAQDSALAPDRRGRKGSNIVGPYIPYDLLQTKGETYAKFGWDRLRNVDLYKVQTNKTEQKPISALSRIHEHQSSEVCSV